MPKELKERGIMFRGELVREIYSDVKTNTRRLDKSWLNVKEGRRLWVRETWRPVDHHFEDPPQSWLIECRADREAKDARAHWCNVPDEDLAAELAKRFGTADTTGGCDPRWRPSIHMFRWMSRIDLEATADARLEHLLDITEEDAKAEGVRLPVSQDGKPLLLVSAPHSMREWTFREAFLCLWSQMHKKSGERVEDNPELVRIAFKRIQL